MKNTPSKNPPEKNTQIKSQTNLIRKKKTEKKPIWKKSTSN